MNKLEQLLPRLCYLHINDHYCDVFEDTLRSTRCLRLSASHLTQYFSPHQLLQIHRRIFVNPTCLLALRRRSTSDYEAWILQGEQVIQKRVGRAFLAQVQRFLARHTTPQ